MSAKTTKHCSFNWDKRFNTIKEEIYVPIKKQREEIYVPIKKEIYVPGRLVSLVI